MTPCGVSGCESPQHAKGMCKIHYARKARTGRAKKSPPGPTPRPLAERFWAKVDKSGECWKWIGGQVDPNGYGRLQYRLAHRIAWELTYGPTDSFLDHMCRNPICVRPDHLQEVTAALNSQNLAGAHRDSKTGVRGVWWNTQRQKYEAAAQVAGKKHRAGFFDSIQDAEAAVVLLRNRVMVNNLLDRNPSP